MLVSVLSSLTAYSFVNNLIIKIQHLVHPCLCNVAAHKALLNSANNLRRQKRAKRLEILRTNLSRKLGRRIDARWSEQNGRGSWVVGVEESHSGHWLAGGVDLVMDAALGEQCAHVLSHLASDQRGGRLKKSTLKRIAEIDLAVYDQEELVGPWVDMRSENAAWARSCKVDVETGAEEYGK
jgi:hypothetical protein